MPPTTGTTGTAAVATPPAAGKKGTKKEKVQGKTLGAKFKLDRNSNNNGIDDNQGVHEETCPRVGSHLRCEACWIKQRNITEHWRDHCVDATALNRLRNLYNLQERDLPGHWFYKIATDVNGVPSSVILKQNSSTWTPDMPIEVPNGMSSAPYKGKSYDDLIDEIIDEEDYKLEEELSKIPNVYARALARSAHKEEDYNKNLLAEFKKLPKTKMFAEHVNKEVEELLPYAIRVILESNNMSAALGVDPSTLKSNEVKDVVENSLGLAINIGRRVMEDSKKRTREGKSKKVRAPKKRKVILDSEDEDADD